jgi:hypothetical protein
VLFLVTADPELGMPRGLVKALESLSSLVKMIIPSDTHVTYDHLDDVSWFHRPFQPSPYRTKFWGRLDSFQQMLYLETQQN